MNKDLIIIGSYPSTEKGISILKDLLYSLKSDFDIALSTHYPADKDIQFLVNYYIYDIRNEFIINDSIHFWADYYDFYLEVYDDKTNPHHSFAVYRDIMNAINMLKNAYDSFYYIEGDCLFDAEDIEKLKGIKILTENQNKEAAFFYFPEFLSTLIFYSKMDFFIDTFSFPNTVQEYVKISDDINSYGILENFLYRHLLLNQKDEKIIKFENIHPTDYFKNSKLGMNTFFEKDVVIMKSFKGHVVKIENTDQFAFIYVNNNDNIYKNPLKVYLDNEYIDEIPSGKCATAIRIYPKNENFIIDVEGIKIYCTKQNILNGRSFIRFKH